MDNVARYAESSLVAALNVVVDVLVWTLAVGCALLWAMLLPPNRTALRRAFLILFFGFAAICWRAALVRTFGMPPGIVDALWALLAYGVTLVGVPLAVREAARMRYGVDGLHGAIRLLLARVDWRRR